MYWNITSIEKKQTNASTCYQAFFHINGYVQQKKLKIAAYSLSTIDFYTYC